MVQVVQKDDLLVFVPIPPLVVLFDIQVGVLLTDTPALPGARWAPDPLVVQLRKVFRLFLVEVVQCNAVRYSRSVLQ